MNIDFEVLQSQADFITSDAKFTAFIGGIRGGKTFSGAIKALVTAFEFPDATGLICANTYRQLTDYTVKTFFDVMELAGVQYRFLKSEKMIIIPVAGHTAVIHLRSMENYNVIRGGEYGWAWLDEARDMKKEGFNVVIGRLSSPNITKPKCWITTTPNGFDWVYEDFFANPIKDSELIKSRTRDNTFLPNGYVKTLEDTYDPLLAQQELDADFLSTKQGRTYHQFDRGVHVDPSIYYNPSFPILLSFDFNRTPMTASILQRQGNGLVGIDEICIQPNATVWETCAEFIRRYPQDKHRAGLEVYGDATGHAGSVTSDFTSWQIVQKELAPLYEGFEFKVKSANPSIVNRVNAFNALLRSASGNTRLKFSDKCIEVIKDCEQMTNKEGTNVPDKDKDKSRSHMSDNVGYVVESLFPIKVDREWGVSIRS